MFSPGSPFHVGANLPWIQYGGDFGANAWRPEGGLAASGIPEEVRARITTLREREITSFRWFLFCDGRAGIRWSDDGTPLGLDAHVVPDLDAALTFASEAGIQVMFTLFDFLWCAPGEVINGVQTRGRRGVIADAGKRAALIDRVVRPVVEQCARHPSVCAWDLINEPEHVTLGVGTANLWRAVRAQPMRALIAETVTLIRQMAGQPVTVGLASARGLDLVRDCGLDFYQVHWYDKLDRQTPLQRSVEDLHLDRPVVLGEFPTRGSRRPPDVILQTARDAGYTGAWFWSVMAGDDASDPRVFFNWWKSATTTSSR